MRDLPYEPEPVCQEGGVALSAGFSMGATRETQGLPDPLRHDCRHQRGNGRATTAGTGGHLCPVSSRTQAEDLECQVQRLLHYCAAKGYQVARSVKEIASGLNDNRP